MKKSVKDLYVTRYREAVPFVEILDKLGNWDVEKTCKLLTNEIESAYTEPNRVMVFMSQDSMDKAVWDGWFECINGIPYYVGADGPCGGSGQQRKIRIKFDDLVHLV